MKSTLLHMHFEPFYRLNHTVINLQEKSIVCGNRDWMKTSELLTYKFCNMKKKQVLFLLMDGSKSEIVRIILLMVLFTGTSGLFAQKTLLYLKGGNPSTWTNTGIPGNQHEEITRWTSAGYNVQTMNLTTTTITYNLLTSYQVLRLNGELGPRDITQSEGDAIYTWVLSGGKLLADIGWTKMVPAISSFGVVTIEGQNGGGTGLDWYFNGAPMVDGPITGPEGGVTSFASSAMDHPMLSSNNNLIVDYYKSGYPMIVHNQFGAGKVIIVFTNSWSHDEDWPTNAYQANIFEEDNIDFLENCIQYFVSNLLYLKGGDPSTWTNTGVPGNQHEEITRWTNAGYNVQTLNLTTTTITSSLLAGYQVLRLNGELGPRDMTQSEGDAIYSWVLSGGKLLADIGWKKMVPAISSFGVVTIEGQNGGSTGLDWYFHGAPMYDGPVTGPEGVVTSFASSAMDHPMLASNNNLVVDYYKSGYPMIVHNQFSYGKVVIVFTNSWSHDEDWPTNAYQANIFDGDNIEFLENCIQYFSTLTGMMEHVIEPNNSLGIYSFPNPFISETIIRFRISSPGMISLVLYNVNGKKISNILQQQYYTKGEHEVILDDENLMNGVYILELISDDSRMVGKIIKNSN
jgi:hypothetical protein